MSPSDIPNLIDTGGLDSLNHVKGTDDRMENIEDESSRVDANRGGTSTETGSPAAADRSSAASDSYRGRAMADNINGPGTSFQLFDEIRYLQERLLYLEDRVAHNHGKDLEQVTPSGKDSVISEQKASDLRKQIRQAASAETLVKKAEREAEKTAEQRKSYGQGPNSLSRSELKGLGGSPATMYHIRDDGSMGGGTQFHAMGGEGSWLVRDRNSDFPEHWPEVELRAGLKPHPHRGIRPPTALRPIYGTTDGHGRKFHLIENAKISRKLGPPNQWDESDSEEWSSDTSTGMQDFDYYRARLRGDFEWELDRLNAQVTRFRRHKAKKEARQRSLEKKDEGGNTKEEEEASEEQGSLLKGEKEVARPRLNPVGWETFQNAKTLPKKLASVIDVLTEEPRIGAEFWSNIKRPGKSSKNYKGAKPVALSHKTAGKGKVENEVDPGTSSYQPDQFSGPDPLPERIRVNSRILIEALSDIHGTPICEDSTHSLIILRPFKILSAYEKEIRGLSIQLATEIETLGEEQVSPEDATTHSVPPDSTSADKKPSDPSQNAGVDIDESTSKGKDAVKAIDSRTRKEHLACLQDFMENYINKKVAYLNGLSCSKIAFLDLWYLFRPGATVMSTDGKQAYQVISVRSKQHKGVDRRSQWAAFEFADSEDSDSSTSRYARNEYHDMTIKCVYIHFDGHNIGPVIRSFGINKWDGVKDIAFLEVCPLRLHVLSGLRERAITSSNGMEITEEDVDRATRQLQHGLIKRGKKFVGAAAVKHMYYSGLAVDTRDEIESQVVIDFEAAFSDDSREHWVPKIRRLLGTDWNSENKSNGEKCSAECCYKENVLDDSHVDTNNSQNFVNNLMSKVEHTSHKLPPAIIFPRPLDENKSQSEEFTEDELMIMSYSVFGFVLRDRTWAELDLEYLTDVRASRSDEGGENSVNPGQGTFAQLVLPPGHKKMVLSLISQHFRNKGSSDVSEDSEQLDIVRGKGKGLIILLHGAPGVGKTTTAEGVAETFGKPLFQITCGDLGSTPKAVELALQTNFALANRWGCILLLDEADVFLAERRREDFNRNGMVAVFLRVLEYYAGILFLTTNRIGDFDEAFASRIHMSLHYPVLDRVSTMKVFKLNLGMIKNRLKERIEIDEEDIIDFAMEHWRIHKDARWNGRQIRNACQTALALAENDAQPKGQEYNIKGKYNAKVHLTLEHLKIVSDSYLEFTNYLKAVHGADAEVRAKESGLRALDTLLEALKSDKGKHHEDNSGHSETGQGKPAAKNSPLQSFTLRPSSTGPYLATPSTPETRSTQPAHQSGWASPQGPHESTAFQSQRMEHDAQRYYAGTQSYQPYPVPQPGTPTTQPGSAGRHPHTPQPHGHPMAGQFQAPAMHQTQGSQSYEAAYPGAVPSTGYDGPSAHGAGPGYHRGSGQGG